MINRLPSEVILAISAYLDLKDKLILITTCRKVHNLVSQITLFSELQFLTKGKEEINQIFNIIKDHPSYGKQVKELQVSMYELSDTAFDQLSSLFPNVTRVKCPLICEDLLERLGMIARSIAQPTTLDRSGSLNILRKGPLVEWSKTIEKYCMLEDWSMIGHYLEVNTFPRLTELELGFVKRLQDKKRNIDAAYLLPHIQHAPALKKLTLDTCTIDLAFLEEIHNSCPFIESLSIDSFIMQIGDALVQPIIPVYSVSRLKMNDIYCSDKYGIFLDYITSKYKQLQHLELGFEHDCEFEQFTRIYGKTKISKALQLLNKDLKSGTEIYRSLGEKFFMNLPSTIKSIKIPYYLFDNTIDAIIKSKLKPVQLEFTKKSRFESTKNPSQIYSIPQFTSLKSLSLDFQFAKHALYKVFPSSIITKLRLGHYKTIYIDQILPLFPSLEQLYLHNGGLISILKDDGPEPCFPNLLVLDIDHVSIDQKCIQFLKSTAPNITCFNFNNFLSPINGHKLKIDISGWKLRTCRITLSRIHFTTLPNIHLTKLPNYYKVTMQNLTEHIEISGDKNVTFRRPRDTPTCDFLSSYVHIECGANEKIIIHGCFSVSKFMGRIHVGLK